MLMLQMSGGMGNQMFQYALYRALQAKGKEVCLEDFTHFAEIDRHDNQLEQIFPLTYTKTDRRGYNRLTDSSLLPWMRVRRKLFGRKQKVYQEKDAITFEQEVFDLDEGYCIGYWQSERYFESVKDQLRKDFAFDWAHFPKEALAFRERMQAGNSVSIHVRRGDYLSDKFKGIYGGICTDAYYEAAMNYCREKLGDCTFYLFTNDPEWGRTQVNENVILVDCADGDTAYLDMALMSSCRHHIIANSSFSWWGAWLDPCNEKLVIAPAKWLNTSDGQDIYDGLCNVKIDPQGRICDEEK